MNLHNSKTLATQDLYVALEIRRRKVSLMSSARKCGICEDLTGDWEDLFSDCNLIEICRISTKLHGVMSKIAVTL